MASKTNMTSPDDDHVQFGNDDHYTQAGLPPDFGNGMGDFEFCPNWFGRTMTNPGYAGFGGAYIEPDEDEDDDE